jgi:hypothetical protein
MLKNTTDNHAVISKFNSERNKIFLILKGLTI